MLKEVSAREFIDNFYSFDLVIDARSPKEFSESHIPTAKNFYALNDSEHKEIGTIYKQSSKSVAKIRGANYICKNTSDHLNRLEKELPIGSRVGIYCARGGLRSTSIATILSFSEYRVYRIKSGYKEYRKFILNYLDSFEHKNFITLGGNTGCGKSELIRSLSPSIDLEGLANHFGSTFGMVNGAQPTQKMFENSLAHNLLKIDPKEKIFVEGESKKIGNIIQPSLFYKRIQEGFRVEITAPLEQRVQRILKDYANIDDEYFFWCMQRIKPYIKRSARVEVIESYKKGNLEKVAEILLIDYYDKVYKKPARVDLTLDNSNPKETLKVLESISKNPSIYQREEI